MFPVTLQTKTEVGTAAGCPGVGTLIPETLVSTHIGDKKNKGCCLCEYQSRFFPYGAPVMRISILNVVLLVILLSAGSGWGQPFPLLKKGEELVPTVSPAIYRATATEVNGEVVIRLSSPGARITDKKDAQGVTVTVCVWEDRKPLTLGKEVKAYNQAGKPLSKESVLKALAKKVSVVCFVRSKPNDPVLPDPLYTSMFRKDVVLLVFRAHDLLR